MSAPDRRAMLDRADRTLSLRRQCAASWRGALGRSTGRASRPTTTTPRWMRWIDELFTAWPFLGSRRMTAMLRGEGVFVNREARPAADASDGDRGARAAAENEQARARPQDLSLSPAQSGRSSARTTSGLPTSPYIPIRARLSLSRGDHRLGNRARCLGGGCRTRWTFRSVWAALEEALAKFGKPEIFNTDQGLAVHTSAAFNTGALADAGIA